MTSEPKWTAGPWKNGGPDDFGDHPIGHNADNLAVAAVVTNLRSPDEVAANAHLIAAAPDLYEALNVLVLALCHEHNKNIPYWQEAVSALAKARGES